MVFIPAPDYWYDGGYPIPRQRHQPAQRLQGQSRLRMLCQRDTLAMHSNKFLNPIADGAVLMPWREIVFFTAVAEPGR